MRSPCRPMRPAAPSSPATAPVRSTWSTRPTGPERQRHGQQQHPGRHPGPEPAAEHDRPSPELDRAALTQGTQRDTMQSAARKYSRGMTLIELMIVVVIASILVSIAVPPTCRRCGADGASRPRRRVLDLAGREERYFSTTPRGRTIRRRPADLGYAALPANLAVGLLQPERLRGRAGTGRRLPAECPDGPGLHGHGHRDRHPDR